MTTVVLQRLGAFLLVIGAIVAFGGSFAMQDLATLESTPLTLAIQALLTLPPIACAGLGGALLAGWRPTSIRAA